jgi:two-component system, cell cycle response regulator
MTETIDKKKRILIAEDDPVSRRLLEVFLVKWGFEVVVATNGTDALQLLERMDAPRLAVLDWMMPGLEGVQVCQKLRADTDRPYVYVLLLTARSQKEDLLHGLESGADDYLTKPFDAQELRARLHVGQRILDLQDRLISISEELLFRATHDTLTGVANRGVILDTVSRERMRQARDGRSFGIVMVDVDHFKYVNDTYGHQIGDVVLQEVSKRMSASVRPYDFVGRYGGEEFLIVVPASVAAGLMSLAERIRKAIECEPVHTTAGEIPITASFGVAVSTDSNPYEAQELLRLADDALYRAKQHGRNRCELASDEEVATVHSGPIGAKSPAPAGQSASR